MEKLAKVRPETYFWKRTRKRNAFAEYYLNKQKCNMEIHFFELLSNIIINTLSKTFGSPWIVTMQPI